MANPICRISDMEQFKPVPGYDGRFEVSLNGTVRTTPYTDKAGKHRKSRTIRPNPNRKTGHLMVRLCYNGTVLTTSVHRLMLSAWVRPPLPGEEACHHNDIPDDNRLENLYWGTHTDNMRDAVRNKGNHNSKKTHCKHGHPLSGENLYVPPGKPTWRMCKKCMKRLQTEKYDRINPGRWRRGGRYCKRGHEFTKENTYIDPRGKRNCIICRDRREREYKRKHLTAS